MDLVLVVDDEPDILELLRLNLSQAGYGVETAATGEEAFRCFDRSEPDLVILDLMLPDCSGTDICRKIRSGSTRPDVPILMPVSYTHLTLPTKA